MSDLSLPKEYEQSWCEIKTAENALIAVGKIRTIAPKYIIINDKEKELPLISPGTLMKINIFNPKKEIRVCIGNIYTSSKGELSLVNVISLVNTEKRNFFRADVCINTIAVYRKDQRSLYPSETDIVVLDMSFSGLRFKSKTILKQNTVIGVKLNLQPKKETILQCEIVRIIDENHNGELNYGCRFVFGDSVDIDVLCSFLFDKQKEFIKNSQNTL